MASSKDIAQRRERRRSHEKTRMRLKLGMPVEDDGELSALAAPSAIDDFSREHALADAD